MSDEATAMDKRDEQARIEELASMSPDERTKAREEYNRRFKAFVEAGGDAEAPYSPRARAQSEPIPLADLLARVRERIDGETSARMALPCYRAMYPDGVEPDDEADRVPAHVGSAACEEVGAWRDCDRAMSGYGCPRVGAVRVYEVVRERMARARVPRDDYHLVLAHAAGKAKLYPYDAMRFVAAYRKAAALYRQGLESRVEVRFEEANEQLVGDRERKNMAHIRGSESVVLMGGNRGRGKTTAAVYALAYEGGIPKTENEPPTFGGLYTTEYNFTRPKNAGGQDIVEAKRARVLVIDQFGRGNLGDSKYALSAIEEVIDYRKAEHLTTYVVGNFKWDDAFKRRYDELVVSRILGHGVVVVFRGRDLREQLRAPAEGEAA